jgi:hypothetical protein
VTAFASYISPVSLSLSLVTRHCVDASKLRLGQGREWIRRGSVLDWKLLYGILVGDRVILDRRSHLGGMGSDLCQESERHHQGTILLCMNDFNVPRKACHTHSSSLASLYCHNLLDCAIGMATVSLVHGSTLVGRSQYMVPHCPTIRLQAQLHQGPLCQYCHFQLLYFVDCHSVLHLSLCIVHVSTHGSCDHCRIPVYLALGTIVCSHSLFPLRIESQVDL